jgi:hypothetical protein
VVSYPIQQGGGHFFIAKDLQPFGEIKIGGNAQCGFLVELANQVEQ